MPAQRHDEKIGTRLAQMVRMNATVRNAHTNYLVATIALESAIVNRKMDDVLPLAEHKTECVDQLIKALRAADPLYFELSERPRRSVVGMGGVGI